MISYSRQISLDDATKQQSPAAAIGRRRPASLDEFKKAFYYALGNAERLVSPKHHNYQVRLRRYLELKKVPAEFEKDFIDVR